MRLHLSRSAIACSHEAFRLRAALLTLLSRAEPSDGEREAIATASAAAWRLLLTAECCALGVADALRRSDLRDRMSSDCRAELDGAELRETQRVTAARSVLRSLDLIASRVGASPTVVKGGATAADRSRLQVDLGDVDALVDSADARILWEELRRAGWTPKSEGLSPNNPAASERNHFAPLLPPGAGLPLELHHRLDYGDTAAAIAPEDTIPIPGYRALRRLKSRVALPMMLTHTVVKHPFRRGHLRDLILFADEVAHADTFDFREVERSLASERYAPELTEMLHQVEAMCDGRHSPESHATRCFVAWKYGTVLRASMAFREWIPGWSSISFVTLERPTIRRAQYRALLTYAVGAVPADSPLRARWPGGARGIIPRAAMRLSRSAYRLSLTLVLCLGAWYLRRSVAAMIDPRADDAPEARFARSPSG